MKTSFFDSGEKPFVDIPATGGRYKITKDGDIYDLLTKGIVEQHETVCLNIAGLNYFFNRWLLLTIAYHGCKIPPSKWAQLSVGYLDGNRNNRDIYNLELVYPQHGLPLDEHYFYIPGFTDYGIDIHGSVFSLKTHKLLSPYRDKAGYVMYGLTPDIGRRVIVSRHRLLCVVFKHPNSDVTFLDVNHINGSKGDDRLDNLEWVTRRENNLHAARIGLKTDVTPILVRDCITGEIVKYFSVNEASRQLGIPRTTILLRLKSDGALEYAGRQFKYADSTSSWGGHLRCRPGLSKSVKVVDTVTGEVKNFASLSQAATYTGIHLAVISSKLKTVDSFIFRNFNITTYRHSPTVEPTAVVPL